jgi:hypothetical protein
VRKAAIVVGVTLLLAGAQLAAQSTSGGGGPSMSGRSSGSSPGGAGRHGGGGHGGGRGYGYARGGHGHGYGHGWGYWGGYRPYWGNYGYPRYYYGWGPGWWGPWGAWGYGAWGYGYTSVYPRSGWRHGALDTDLVPERAEVWVDGQRVGVADDFDGFPDYLWLEEGTYDVVFFTPGRRTLARQYTIYPGLVIDVEDRLEEGEAVHPLDLATKSHERRDERLRRDRETRENAEQMERERALEYEEPPADESYDARGEPGRLELAIAPDDASVYLDGRFLGSAGELARLRAGLLVDPGRHRLEIVRPGYRGVELEVTVDEGGEERIDVALESAPGESVN